MNGGGSRRIEGRGNIQRPGDFEFINTSYLPPEKTIQAVSYYNRRKEELKMNAAGASGAKAGDRNPGAANLKSQVQNVMKSSKLAGPHANNHIKEVRVEPVIPDSSPSAFNSAKYPLSEEERVTVVEERYFPVQGYYNFVYETQLKKEMSKFVNETEAKVLEVVHDQMADRPRTEQEDLMKEKSEHYLDEQPQLQLNGKTARDNNQNRLNSKVGNSKVGNSKASGSFPVNQLVPVHMDYASRNSQRNLVFTVNQNTRLELSRRR